MPPDPLTLTAPGLPALPEDERTLLLLGLLTTQDRHGYQINDFIEHHLQHVIELKKATAYQLLERLEQHGLVESRIEQHGQRPNRKVYHITAAGRQRFRAMLLGQLRQDEPLHPNGNVPIMFSETLSRAEMLTGLQERLEHLENRVRQQEAPLPSTPPGLELALRRLRHLTRADRDWLAATLEELRDSPPHGADRRPPC